MSGEIIKINHLSKTFGKNVVLRDIDFSVSTGDVTCIIGASGSGKSTLLRCLNLLETPTTGEILYHGEDIAAAHTNAAAYRAKVGMVFQSFNLFNNMTVLQNCIIGQTKVLKSCCVYGGRSDRGSRRSEADFQQSAKSEDTGIFKEVYARVTRHILYRSRYSAVAGRL